MSSSNQLGSTANNVASDDQPSESQTQRERHIFFARLSEQSERFDGNFFIFYFFVLFFRNG